MFEQPSGKKKKHLTLVGSLANQKEGRKEVGREGKIKGESKKLEICLYFLRYPWKQMGTSRSFHYSHCDCERGSGREFRACTVTYPVQNIMTSFHLHNFNPFHGSCWTLKAPSASAVPKKSLHLRNTTKISRLISFLF